VVNGDAGNLGHNTHMPSLPGQGGNGSLSSSPPMNELFDSTSSPAVVPSAAVKFSLAISQILLGTDSLGNILCIMMTC
jgi:hypothetical protein